MNCESCGEVCRCSPEPPPNLPSSETAAAGSDAADAPAWRDELSARLNRYRARRKAPPPRYPSLKLPFEAIQSRPDAAVPERSASLSEFSLGFDSALALDATMQEPPIVATVEEQTPPVVPSAPVPRLPALPGAKIIEFPRFAWAPPVPPPDQLAEPVFDRPRILDVPEVSPPAPALGGITIEAEEREEAEKRPGIDIPLQSAPLGRRILAALVDGVIVAAASGLFGFIFWKIASVRPPTAQLLGLVGGGISLFWAAYQYLLVVYAGSTPGLQAARLELSRFDGTPVPRSLRRWRILASYLSAVSMGMGYIWVFLDEDVLCWHDRITRTYLAAKPR